MNTIKLDSKHVQMIAHRGLSGLERENTCAAFVAAGNREKYYGIETDIHSTSDGKFIIIHDDTTGRVCGGDNMTVEETTFDTLRKLQVSNLDDGQRSRGDLILPTLEEYISIGKKYEKVCVLELKNEFPKEILYQIIERIEELGYLDHTIFISFALNNLIWLRERYPKQPAQYLLSKWGEDSMEILKKYDLDLDIDYRQVTKELCDAIHAEGKIINCWTCNTAEAGAALVEMGVDQITTNILE